MFFQRAFAVSMLGIAGLAFHPGQASAALTVVDENFASGSASGLAWTSSAAGPSNGQQWIWSSPDSSTPLTFSEVWVGTGGASARGLATTYDHDQNGGTANINIPGGFEVMSDPDSTLPNTVRVAMNFTLPSNLGTIGSDNGDLSFFIANRLISGSGGQGAAVELFNLTDNRSILSLTSLNPFSAGNTNWTFKLLDLNFIDADRGDVVQLRFQESILGGSSGGARGLQVADVTLSVAILPEPASLTLLGMATLSLMRRRRSR